MNDSRYPKMDSAYPAPATASSTSASRPVTKSEPVRRVDRFQSGPMSFRRPDDWKDITVFAAQGPTTPGKIPPLVRVGREPMRGVTLRAHADRILLALAKEAPAFELVDSTSGEVAGRPAVFLRCRLMLPTGQVEQRFVMVDPGADREGGVFAFTASSTPDQQAVAGAMLDELLRSVQFEATFSVETPSAPTLPSSTIPPALRAPSRPPPPEPDFDAFANSIPMPGQRVRR